MVTLVIGAATKRKGSCASTNTGDFWPVDRCVWHVSAGLRLSDSVFSRNLPFSEPVFFRYVVSLQS